jgi:ABC-type methionine transport system ATPase subunit
LPSWIERVKGGGIVVKRQVTLTFPQELLREPIIYTLGQQFKVSTNIYRADIAEDKGWMVLELEGEEEDIEQGIAWMTSKGVRVDAAIGDIGQD